MAGYTLPEVAQLYAYLRSKLGLYDDELGVDEDALDDDPADAGGIDDDLFGQAPPAVQAFLKRKRATNDG